MSLVFLAFAFVGLGVSNTGGFGDCSGVDSGVEFFSGNILLLKLLRNFFLALSRNPTFFREDFYLYLYLSILPDDNGDIFAAVLLISYCSFSSPILSLIVRITFHIFFLKDSF